MQYLKQVNHNKIVQALDDVNAELSLHGYFLTKEDVAKLRETQRLACRQNKMIEFDIQVLFLIAMHMRYSPYITIDRFLPSIKEMIFAYYAVRARSNSQLTDEEITSLLYEEYMARKGSIDLYFLQGVLRNIKKRATQNV